MAEEAPPPSTPIITSSKAIEAEEIAAVACAKIAADIEPLVAELEALRQAASEAPKKQKAAAEAAVAEHEEKVRALQEAADAAKVAHKEARLAIKRERQTAFAICQSERLLVETALRASSHTRSYDEAKTWLQTRHRDGSQHSPEGRSAFVASMWASAAERAAKEAGVKGPVSKASAQAASAWLPLAAANMRAARSKLELQAAQMRARASEPGYISFDRVAELKRRLGSNFGKVRYRALCADSQTRGIRDRGPPHGSSSQQGASRSIRSCGLRASSA